MKIGILGYGLEGKAAHQYFSTRCQCDIYIIDDQTVASDHHKNCHFLIGEEGRKSALEMQFDLIVRSPGVSIYSEFYKKIVTKSVKVTTGANIWFEENQGATTVVITGTKGKSTTSSILAYLLEKSGCKVKLAGNIGIPLIGQTAGQDVTVIELSSYQTADLQFAPDYVLVTNLHPEHLHWHQNVENYFFDKMRICNLSKDTTVLISADDHESKLAIGDRENSFLYSENSIDNYSEDGRSLTIENITIENYSLKGRHNIKNLAGAISLLKMLRPGIGKETIDFDGYQQLPHRLSEHRLSNGVLCVDDSISTIPESTLAAMKVYEGPNLHVFIGGFDRGVDYGDLLDKLPQMKFKAVYFFGPLGVRLFENIGKSRNFIFLHSDDLGGAIDIAIERVEKDDVLLLSPGGTSFDEFDSFKQRGSYFLTKCTEGMLKIAG